MRTMSSVYTEECVLPFTVGGIHGAVPLECVKEVVRATAVERLPAAKGLILGVVDFRGVIVPVVNLRKRFDLLFDGISLTDRFLIVEIENGLVALLVDGVDPVSTLEVGQVQSAKDTSFAGQVGVAGVASEAHGILLIYDLPAFFSATEKQAIEDAREEGA